MREVWLAKVVEMEKCAYPPRGIGKPTRYEVDDIRMLFVGCHIQEVYNGGRYPAAISPVGVRPGLELRPEMTVRFDVEMGYHHCATSTVLPIEDASDQEPPQIDAARVVVRGMLDGLREKWPDEVRNWALDVYEYGEWED